MSYFKDEYAKLGKMSRDEKIGAILTVLLIVFMLTGNLHGIALDWGFIVLPWLMFFPGIKIATEEDVKGVDWSMVFFCIACLSIGTVSSYLGIGELVADLLVPALSGMNSTLVMVAIYAVAVILNFLLTPLAISPASPNRSRRSLPVSGSILWAPCTASSWAATRCSCLTNTSPT